MAVAFAGGGAGISEVLPVLEKGTHADISDWSTIVLHEFSAANATSGFSFALVSPDSFISVILFSTETSYFYFGDVYSDGVPQTPFYDYWLFNLHAKNQVMIQWICMSVLGRCFVG